MKHELFAHALNVGMIAGNSDCCLDGTAGKSGTCSHRTGWASLGDTALDHKPKTVCYITIHHNNSLLHKRTFLTLTRQLARGEYIY